MQPTWGIFARSMLPIFAFLPIVSLAQRQYGQVVKREVRAHKKLKMTVEDIHLYSPINTKSTATITRHAVLVKPPHAKATILICHGFMCDKNDVSFLRYMFPRRLFNTMTFDFRAHGENREGQCCTFGKDEALDVTTAVQFLRNQPDTKNKPIFVYAFSMGAVAAIEAQAKRPLFDAMILDCPFDSSENIIKKGLEQYKVSWLGYEFDLPGKQFLEKYVFHPYVQELVKFLLKTVANMDTRDIPTNICPLHPAESVKKVSVPCFFIYCKNDEKVPIESIQSVYNGAGGYKRLWITNGRRHYDSFFFEPELYKNKVRNFLDKVMRKSFESEEKEGIIQDCV
jgi:pimeloyl-ACP methyl ester carboxylesterase